MPASTLGSVSISPSLSRSRSPSPSPKASTSRTTGYYGQSSSEGTGGSPTPSPSRSQERSPSSNQTPRYSVHASSLGSTSGNSAHNTNSIPSASRSASTNPQQPATASAPLYSGQSSSIAPSPLPSTTTLEDSGSSVNASSKPQGMTDSINNDTLAGLSDGPGTSGLAMADKQVQLGNDLLEVAKEDHVPVFEFDNRAQKGGAAIATGVEVVSGVGALAKGAVKAGARSTAREGDELTETSLRNVDRTAGTVRDTNIAANSESAKSGITKRDTKHSHVDVQTHNPRLNPSTISAGRYTVNPTDIAKHKPEFAPSGKSVFKSNVDAEKTVLDAAQFADEYNLWSNTNKAKVQTNETVGYHGKTGKPVSEVNVYREQLKDGSYNIHGAPASPRPSTSEKEK